MQIVRNGSSEATRVKDVSVSSEGARNRRPDAPLGEEVTWPSRGTHVDTDFWFYLEPAAPSALEPEERRVRAEVLRAGPLLGQRTTVAARSALAARHAANDPRCGERVPDCRCTRDATAIGRTGLVAHLGVATEVPLEGCVPVRLLRGTRPYRPRHLAGLLVALAYAFLAGLPPLAGLYSSLFPVLVYILTGTSHHSSIGTCLLATVLSGITIGTNIIVSFLTRNAIERFTATSYDRLLVEAFEAKNATLLETPPVDFFQLAGTVTLLTGCVHLLIVVFRLDFLLSYVPPNIVSGFSFGIGVRVVLSQLRHLVQLSANAPCDTVFSIACIASLEQCFREINPFVVAFSSCSLLFLLLVKQLLNPLLQIRVHAPFPFEFLLMMFATLMSVVMTAGEKFHVRTLQYSKQGFTISLPRVDALDDFAVDAVAIAFFSLCSHLHLSKEMAKKKPYVVSQRQETLTFSMFEMLTAFFSGLPVGASRSRAETLVHVGAQSLLYNVVVVAGIVPAILWGVPLFSELPLCVLSCVGLCGLRSAFSGIFTVSQLRRISTVDTCSWLWSAMAAVLLGNSSSALGAAVAFGLFSVVLRTQWPECQLLVNVTGSGSYYAEQSRYGSDPVEENGIAVLRFEAPLLFANVSHFKREVHALVDATKGQIMAVGIGTRTGSMKSNGGCGGRRPSLSMRSTLLISGDIVPNYDNTNVDQSLTKIAILDCSSINYVDTVGLEAMAELFGELNAKCTRLFFAAMSASIRDHIQAVHGFVDIPKNCFFPSVHDAVLSAQQIGGVVASNIHMSVSLNGCRDLITLSTANSNHDDLTQRTDLENVQVHPRPASADSRHYAPPSVVSRPSLPEARTTPPIVVSQPLRATYSNS
uniref:STAS domain-containing protein n=1 Tax=Steinernema glaseri TaxID=37863 RepID=A0A1I7YAM3_9BILA